MLTCPAGAGLNHVQLGKGPPRMHVSSRRDNFARSRAPFTWSSFNELKIDDQRYPRPRYALPSRVVLKSTFIFDVRQKSHHKATV